jgi:hypothetical protein
MGREQLVLLALVVFIALIDLVSRWARGRSREPEPTYTREEPAYTQEEPAYTEDEPVYTEEEPAYSDEPAHDDAPVFTVQDEPEWLRSRRAKLERPPLRARAVPPQPAPVTPVYSPIRSARRSHWLRHPANARKAIVMMTVLGRCRGLD